MALHHNQEAPVASVICSRKMLKNQVDMLYENLKNPKPVYHITSPRKFPHLERNAKRELKELGKPLITT